MKKLIAIWSLSLILVNALLFLLAKALTATLWITFGFELFAFIAVLILWLSTFKNGNAADKQFLSIPTLTVSLSYLAFQFLMAIVFSLGAAAISARITTLIHIIVLIVAWIIMIGGLVGNSHIDKVNSRQKNNHREL